MRDVFCLSFSRRVNTESDRRYGIAVENRRAIRRIAIPRASLATGRLFGDGDGRRHGIVCLSYFPRRFLPQRCPRNMHELPRHDHTVCHMATQQPRERRHLQRLPRSPYIVGGPIRIQGQGRFVARHRFHPALGTAGHPAFPGRHTRCRRELPALPCRTDRRGSSRRTPAGRFAMLGLSSGGAARFGAQSFGDARHIPAATALGPRTAPTTHDRRKTAQT